MIKSNEQFIDICKSVIKNRFNNRSDKTDKFTITKNDVYDVWYCKTLQNHKALLSTTVPDGMYYECTYNGDDSEMYVDAYKKWSNECISLDDLEKIEELEKE